MCGILGSLIKTQNLNAEKQFYQALNKINHRGPDDRGCEIYKLKTNSSLMLGHTRLSILDLSSAGCQPMISADGNLSIIFNGEIYNYKELKKDLICKGYEFKTETDTEVLLYAFHFWGIDCLTKLRGMFAFCIFDTEKEKITLARDAFGIKPLYFYQRNESFIFSSEINPILDLLETKPVPNLQTAYDYLINSEYDSSGQTFFEGIEQLMPATYIEFDLAEKKMAQPVTWWRPNTKKNNTITFEEASTRLRKLFLDNVRLHLRSDVPVGAALSGGIDSSAIVCAMRYLEPNIPIHTFSYIDNDSNKSEEQWVDLVNNNIDSIEHKVSANVDELINDLDDLIQTQAEPFGSTSIYAQYRVYKLANQHGIKVTLDGQGADELLAGYAGYPGERMLSLLEGYEVFKAVMFSYKWAKFSGQSYIKSWLYFFRKVIPNNLFKLARRVTGKNLEPDWLNINLLKKSGVSICERRPKKVTKYKTRRVIEQLANSLKNRGLPSLLRHGDRNSMRFSVESRVPFLTIDMVDFLYTLPEHFLISDNGETKKIFRHAMNGILPDKILQRQDKIGFEINSNNWKGVFIKEIQKSEKDNLSDLINFDLVISDKAIGEEKLYWRLLNYIKWHNHYFSKDNT